MGKRRLPHVRAVRRDAAQWLRHPIVVPGVVSHEHAFGRVAPGGYPPGAPTDPDVRVYRIRLFEGWVRYAGRSRLSAGFGNGKRRRIRYMPFQ